MDDGDSRRSRRRSRWESSFSPWALAATGAAISGAYLFQRSLAVRAIMFLFFLGMAWLAGKKLSLVATLIVAAGITAANLLVPVGRVIAVMGPFRLTETALLDGLGKALVFEGLIHISKASIVPGLRLPGRFGSLVASAFVYYDRIVEYKGSLKPATLMADADALMLRIWDDPPPEKESAQGPATEAAATGAAATGTASTVALVAVVLLSYLALFIKG